MEYIPLEVSKNRTIMEQSEMSCVLNLTIALNWLESLSSSQPHGLRILHQIASER